MGDEIVCGNCGKSVEDERAHSNECAVVELYRRAEAEAEVERLEKENHFYRTLAQDLQGKLIRLERRAEV